MPHCEIMEDYTNGHQMAGRKISKGEWREALLTNTPIEIRKIALERYGLKLKSRSKEKMIEELFSQTV